MNNQEREIIGGIFDRLKSAEATQRDPEADRFIHERIAAQPYAPYAMAQTIYVQEQALDNMHARLQELEAENARLQQQGGGGGFFGKLFGGGAPAPRPMQRPMEPAYQPANHGGGMVQPAGPWGRQQQGGGFMATAMTTAVGVAGGMMLASALTGAFASPAEAAPPAEAPPEEAAMEDAGMDDMGGGEF